MRIDQVLGPAALGVAVTLAVLLVLSLIPRVRWAAPLAWILALPLAVNAPLMIWWATGHLERGWRWAGILLGVLVAVAWAQLAVAPVRDGIATGVRAKVLGGAAPILTALCGVTLLQVVVLPVLWVRGWGTVPHEVIVGTLGWSLVCCLVLYLDGALRAVVLSKSLSIVSRVFLLATLWVPLVGWLAGIQTARVVRREYLAVVDRVAWERTLPRDDRCATRYPIILVHGVGWRDRVMFNAFGRIPAYLKRHGAQVFHGEQEAWGTIEHNGRHLARRIDEVLEQTGAAKVNIIAHSRGGIDARQAITACSMGDRVASLTTMNTPHHGVRFADTATKMHTSLYRGLSATVDRLFRLAGDTEPDFHTSTMAFRTELAREFNRATPNDPRVYYQSYTSVMTHPSSHRWLAVPFRVITALGEENDGLVSVDSARWGEFRGVFRSTSRRGVSHGDLVDMDREDFAGFNVLEAYITLVADLKRRGF